MLCGRNGRMFRLYKKGDCFKFWSRLLVGQTGKLYAISKSDVIFLMKKLYSMTKILISIYKSVMERENCNCQKQKLTNVPNVIKDKLW